MEALTISAANLDTIERNLGFVADELSGVISNVSSVNSQVNKVENQVNTLNNEVKSLVKEIRETTIVSNARQSIMYNNELIDKKFSYYDAVRRKTEALLDAVLNSSISRANLYNLNQELLLNNPNYWLANALSAISFWILNDKMNTQREVNNALKKNKKKTCLFFTLVNIKVGRLNPAINWLKMYLSNQNPLELDKDFITVLDLAATGTLSDTAKEIVLNKIDDWFKRLRNDSSVHNKQKELWKEYISENEDDKIYMPYLDVHAIDVNVLKHNIITTSSYHNVYNNLNRIIEKDNGNKSIDDILKNLIYDYEDKEQIYQLDNLKNSLIIACNGDTTEATRLFKKQESLYQKNVDIMTLLSNIVIFDTVYDISNETKKIALSLVKDYIIEAYMDINKTINKNDFNIEVNGFNTFIGNNIDRDRINKELRMYVEKEYISDDKDLIIILLILNILGIMGIFITLNSKLFSFLLIAIIIVGDIFLMLKMNKRNKLRMEARNKLYNNINNNLERVMAESVDYYNLLKNDEIDYNKLINYLNTLNASNFMKNNNERNIKIGE